MKFDFWFDLPKALVNISQDTMTKEELDFCRILNKSVEDFNNIFNLFNQNFEASMQHMHGDELQKIREKLFLIQREKVDLLCKSIKFSTKMMTKILTSFESEDVNVSQIELLTKIKLFLKITRMVVDNSKLALNESKAEREREFFTMINVFSEKIQSKLFGLSNLLINKILLTKMNEQNKEKNTKCKEEIEIGSLIEKKSFVVEKIK